MNVLAVELEEGLGGFVRNEMEDLARGGLSRLEALHRGNWKAAIGKIGKP